MMKILQLSSILILSSCWGQPNSAMPRENMSYIYDSTLYYHPDVIYIPFQVSKEEKIHPKIKKTEDTTDLPIQFCDDCPSLKFIEQ